MIQPEDIVRVYFHETWNPLKRIRCWVLGHRPVDLLGVGVLICMRCEKVRP